MKVIGITGGVGCGKSEVLSYIATHYKCKVYLADKVAAQLQRKGNKCYERLVALLGEGILGADGEIDRPAMAKIIFADDELLQEVNRIVHPLVYDFILNEITTEREKGELELFFIEAALLIEAGYKTVVDEMWYIYSTQEVRRQRLVKSRGYSQEKITDIMESQLSEEEFRKNCDFVIDNSGSLEVTHQTIRRRLEEFTWVQ